MFYVYELRDNTGKPFYIGKGSGKRMHQHEYHARAGRRSHLCNKIRKLLALGERIQKAIVFESPSESEAFAEEKRLISYYGRDTLTNQTDGGDGPSNPSQDIRDRIAAGRRGIIASEATRNLLRLAHIGLKHTKKTRAKIAAKQRTISKPWAVNSRPNLGNGFAGRKWSAEHRAKFLAKRIGHIVTQETRNKISASKKGKPWKRKTKTPTAQPMSPSQTSSACMSAEFHATNT